MLHEYKMKRFIKDQCLFFVVGLLILGYLVFVFRKRLWFGLLLDAIILLPILYVCRRLIVLPLDMLMKPKTQELRFAAKTGSHELQYFREYYCYEWEFRAENGRTLRLMIPEATKQKSIIQPNKDRLVRIRYYRLSKLLLSWEIIE